MNDIPQLNPEDESQIRESLEREHVRPAYKFQGKELWPYTRGTKLIYSQIVDDDTILFRALAFVFIHLKRTEATCKADMARYVTALAWDVNRFRAEIMEFRESLTDEDEAEAIRIMNECFDNEHKSSIRAGAPDGATTQAQKKMESTPATSLGQDSSLALQSESASML